MAETRKLAAIMAVDVVGHPRLMGEDEAGTARVVREHREHQRRVAETRMGSNLRGRESLILQNPGEIDLPRLVVLRNRVRAHVR